MQGAVYKYTIQPRDIDLTRRATLVALSDVILDAAGRDAEVNGFGISRLNDNNWTWVLSRLGVEVDRYPDECEDIDVRTWVGEVNRLMTIRNFVVTDNSGSVIARATSLWAMIDIGTRQPQDLSKNLDYAKIVRDEPTPMERPLKIGKIEGREVLRHSVAYSDIDFNCHANSMKYLQWALDTLPLEKLTGRHISRLDINYNKETLYGQNVSVVSVCSEVEDLFDIIHEDGVSACRVRLKWN